MAEGDEPTEPNDDPGPPDAISTQAIWRSINPAGSGWGPGHLEGKIDDVRLITPTHDSTIRRLECDIRVRTDGLQDDIVYARVGIWRRIDFFPDALVKQKVIAFSGSAETIISDISRVARKVTPQWRYYGRIEILRTGFVGYAGWLNGPVSPAWRWLED